MGFVFLLGWCCDRVEPRNLELEADLLRPTAEVRESVSTLLLRRRGRLGIPTKGPSDVNTIEVAHQYAGSSA